MADEELKGWTFSIRERSAEVYDGSCTHVDGATVGAVGSDPNALLAKLQQDARDLQGS